MEFSDLRSHHQSNGTRISIEDLQKVPYDQLELCAIGSAGDAACSLKLVREEKAYRRARFIAMSPPELEECTNHLRLEGMYEDVMHQREMIDQPKWASLSHSQKAWAKLVCMHSHTDNIHTRISETLTLLRKDTVNRPSAPLMTIMQKLKTLGLLYPLRLSELALRDRLLALSHELRNQLSEEEQMLCEKELIQDFSCTSDCFRVPLT